MTTDELWNGVLGELELEISKPNFITWFVNTFIYSMENGEVVVLKDNDEIVIGKTILRFNE